MYVECYIGVYGVSGKEKDGFLVHRLVSQTPAVSTLVEDNIIISHADNTVTLIKSTCDCRLY